MHKGNKNPINDYLSLIIVYNCRCCPRVPLHRRIDEDVARVEQRLRSEESSIKR